MDIFKCVGLHDPQLLKNMVFSTVLATKFSSKECDTQASTPLCFVDLHYISRLYLSVPNKITPSN